MRRRVGEICGYVAVALLCVAATLSIPARSMGVDTAWEWPATALFVAGVWLSASLVDRSRWFLLVLALLVLAGAVGMDQWMVTNQNDQKTIYVALNPKWSESDSFGWLSVGPFEFAAFALAAVVIAMGIAVRRLVSPHAVVTLALGFIGCAVAALVLDAAAYFFGSARFLDTLQVLFRAYLLPLAVSAVLALILSRFGAVRLSRAS